MTIQSQTAPFTAAHVGAYAGNRNSLEVLVARAVGMFTVLEAWNERARQRHALSQLDSRLLADIGVSHGAAVREVAKRPWEA